MLCFNEWVKKTSSAKRRSNESQLIWQPSCFKLDIDPESLELLETEKHRIEDRRADLVARVQDIETSDPLFTAYRDPERQRYPKAPAHVALLH